MRTVRLTADTQKDLLGTLLKRSPNNYSEYEDIVADIIIAMAPMFWNKLEPDGTLICSGILEERADEVQNALQNTGFLLLNRQASGGWSCLRLRRA